MPKPKTAVASTNTKVTHQTEGSLALVLTEAEMTATVTEETAVAVAVTSANTDKPVTPAKSKPKTIKEVPVKPEKIDKVTPMKEVAVKQTDMKETPPKSTPQPNDISPAKSETITEIPLADLHPPEFHPFHVNDDEAMNSLAENIKQHGVREPGIARPRAEGGYELLVGNRRKRGCEIAKLPTMPIIVRELDDDDATITMVDSNLEHRDRLLPSERAWAYKIKMEALNHKGIKGDKLSAELVAEQYGDSRSQVFRMMRLTNLVIDLLDKVDAGKLAFNPAVELASLSQKEQVEVVNAMEHNEMKPSLSQAVKLRKLKQEGALTKDLIRSVLSEVKAKTPATDKEVIRYRKYFPDDFTATQIDEVILNLLEEYQVKQTAKANAEPQLAQSEVNKTDVTATTSNTPKQGNVAQDDIAKGGVVNG